MARASQRPRQRVWLVGHGRHAGGGRAVLPVAGAHPYRRRLHRVFENAPACLWHEDFSNVKQEIDRLKQTGVEDFRHYFETHPDAVAKCAALIIVLDVNRAAFKLHRAESKDELIGSLTRTFTENSYRVFREELIALASGNLSFGGLSFN